MVGEWQGVVDFAWLRVANHLGVKSESGMKEQFLCVVGWGRRRTMKLVGWEETQYDHRVLVFP